MTTPTIEYRDECDMTCEAAEAETLRDYFHRQELHGENLIGRIDDGQLHVVGNRQEIHAAFHSGRRITLESLTDEQRKRALTDKALHATSLNDGYDWLVKFEAWDRSVKPTAPTTEYPTPQSHPYSEDIIRHWREQSDDGKHANVICWCYEVSIDDDGQITLSCITPQQFHFILYGAHLHQEDAADYINASFKVIEAHIALPPDDLDYTEFNATAPPTYSYEENKPTREDHFVAASKAHAADENANAYLCRTLLTPCWAQYLPRAATDQ